MKRFRVIMSVLLVMLAIGVAVPAVASLFDDGLEKVISGGVVCMTLIPLVGKLETSLQIKEQRGDIYKAMLALNELAKTEKRELTADEQKDYDEAADEFDKLGERLKKVEAQERRAAEMAGANFRESNKNKEKRELGNYSFMRAIKLKAEGRALDGLELEMHQEAEKEARESGQSISGLGVPSMILGLHAEKRAMTATGKTTVDGDQGGMMIATQTDGLVMALRPNLVLAGLGAKVYGGMIGNIDKIRGASTTVAWEDENADANETNVATSKVTLSPKRLAAFTKISKQLLVQTSPSVQNDVMNDMLAAISQAVELSGINGSGSNYQPLGILNTTGIGSVVGGDNGAKPTYAHITELESKVELANAMRDGVAFLTNPKVKNILKNTALDAGSGLFVWPQTSKNLLEYKTAVSNLVPSTLTKGTAEAICSAIIFGDFTQLELYSWGGLDITVDPYTLAGNNQIKLTVNTLWDVFVKQPAAFAAMVDALTA